MSDPTTIYNWRRLDDRVTTSGQPTEGQLAELKEVGVRHVINLGLHTHEKALPGEVGCLAGLGLTYIHIPVAFDQPTEDDFMQFCDAMAKIGNEPVHVHCIANMRVSAFLYRWQRDVLGLDDDQARKLMDSVWEPGGAWAAFIGDEAGVALPHRAADILIRPYASQDREGVVALIVSIQQQEFGIAISAEDQPDLAAIPSFYQSGSGGFWVAYRDGRIVGTIGLKDIGHKQAALRKMFVDPQARGREYGVAAKLLAALLSHAKATNVTDIWLGTTGAFHAAHRFYEKNGLSEVARESLPTSFQIMKVDSKFYRIDIS